jgi:peroxiredoxin
MTDPHDPYTLPPDLPVPVDDGAADHLTGMAIPALSLPSTADDAIDLAAAAQVTLVLYCYPRTGRPGEAPPSGWDEIPGARGCTPQACAFRDHHAELDQLGARVLGLSAQPIDEQREFAQRVRLPYPLVSDPGLALARALDLPTFTFGPLRLYRRLTLIARDTRVAKVFYPVFPPDRNAADVTAWLTDPEHARSALGPPPTNSV